MSPDLVSNEQPRISGHDADALPRLTVIVPLFNEADSIDRLRDGLARLKLALHDQYEPTFLLIDDGSTDNTVEIVRRVFGDDETVRCVRHGCNRGLAAALATGIAEAKTSIVASIDADCTYEPVQLVSLLAKLHDDVDMVVASPYHPLGEVVGVPAWRIGISKMASRLYRMVLRNQLHTYTSCFRVYRRNSVLNLPQTRRDFVGVVEMLWQLDRRGGTILECPAVLTVRQAGQSKMRIMKTALGHLRLFAAAVGQRWKPAPRAERTETFVARPIG